MDYVNSMCSAHRNKSTIRITEARDCEVRLSRTRDTAADLPFGSVVAARLSQAMAKEQLCVPFAATKLL